MLFFRGEESGGRGSDLALAGPTLRNVGSGVWSRPLWDSLRGLRAWALGGRVLRLCVHTRTGAHTLEGELFSATPGGAQGRLLAGSKLKDPVLGGLGETLGGGRGRTGGRRDGWNLEPAPSSPPRGSPDADSGRCQISWTWRVADQRESCALGPRAVGPEGSAALGTPPPWTPAAPQPCCGRCHVEPTRRPPRSPGLREGKGQRGPSREGDDVFSDGVLRCEPADRVEGLAAPSPLLSKYHRELLLQRNNSSGLRFAAGRCYKVTTSGRGHRQFLLQSNKSGFGGASRRRSNNSGWRFAAMPWRGESLLQSNRLRLRSRRRPDTK